MNEIDKNKHILELIIIGLGPAGLTTLVNSSFFSLRLLAFERNLIGGKINEIKKIRNILGFRSIKGIDLVKKIKYQIKKYKSNIIFDEVLRIKKKKFFTVYTKKNYFISKSLIISSGTLQRGKNNFRDKINETNYIFSGCIICKKFLLFEKKIAIIGTNNLIFESSLYISNVASEIFIFYGGSVFDIEKKLLNKIRKSQKIKLFVESTLVDFINTKKRKKIICNLKKNLKKELFVDELIFHNDYLIFNYKIFHCLKICKSGGYIKIKEDCSTKIQGLFAIGNITKPLGNKNKQIV